MKKMNIRITLDCKYYKKKSLNKNKSTKMITQIEVLNYLENKIVTIKVNRNDGNIPNIKITKKAIAFFQFTPISLRYSIV